jgi:hypothetical protein
MLKNTLSYPADREDAALITVMDVAGIGLTDCSGVVVEFIQKASRMIQDHYPGRNAHVGGAVWCSCDVHFCSLHAFCARKSYSRLIRDFTYNSSFSDRLVQRVHVQQALSLTVWFKGSHTQSLTHMNDYSIDISTLQLFLIHVPVWFKVIFKMIKPMLDQDTLSHIHIYTNGYEEKMLEYVDAEDIPVQVRCKNNQ